MDAKRQWAVFGMGAWIAGSAIFALVATENFFTIDRLLADSTNATFRSVVERIGSAQARDFLRYLSSELNRLYFQIWNAAQLAIGGIVCALAWRAPWGTRARWGAAAMLASVVLMVVWLTPQIVSLGRSLDFVPREPPPPGFRTFWILHASYTSLELAKLAVGVLVTVWIIRDTR